MYFCYFVTELHNRNVYYSIVVFLYFTSLRFHRWHTIIFSGLLLDGNGQEVIAFSAYHSKNACYGDDAIVHFDTVTLNRGIHSMLFDILSLSIFNKFNLHFTYVPAYGQT